MGGDSWCWSGDNEKLPLCDTSTPPWCGPFVGKWFQDWGHRPVTGHVRGKGERTVSSGSCYMLRACLRKTNKLHTLSGVRPLYSGRNVTVPQDHNNLNYAIENYGATDLDISVELKQ